VAEQRIKVVIDIAGATGGQLDWFRLGVLSAMIDGRSCC
jgi:hypothetical protein